MSARTGFFEEAPGVFSMTRVIMLLGALGVFVLTCALAGYLLLAFWLTGAGPDSGVIGSVGVPLGLLAAGVWAALKERA